MKVIIVIIYSFLSFSGLAVAAGGYSLNKANIDATDAESLQRGAKIFADRCLSCHAATFMRYNRLADIGLSQGQIKQYFIADNSVKVGDTMKSAIDASTAKQMFGVIPPDLSVVSRSRGADWLYTYFISFYKDDATATGWNNSIFPNVAMPNVFPQEQGVLRAVYASEDKTSFNLEVETPGTLSPREFDDSMLDLTNFLVFMGEPAAEKRKQIGSLVIIFLIIFAFMAWAVKREFWKDVH
ncbi:MAG: cytochrome c1 [Burkholderiales bacterium]|nr:cytochrome c1 [Burkholderiales bacterium]|tara:strand:- start:1042 stop:1761 length:720 start_codon:yes stop_codon:yes gene_type:complete